MLSYWHHLQDELFFYCRECARPGYQPFLLTNTSGLEFYLRQTGATGLSGSTGTVCFVVRHSPSTYMSPEAYSLLMNKHATCVTEYCLLGAYVVYLL